MPLVTLTIRKGKSGEFKSAVLGAVHSALIASGVPEKDRFQRVLELSSDDFRFDPEYPDLTARRTDDFVLIEILLSVGRSIKVKKKIAADASWLAGHHIEPEEPSRERQPAAVPGFRIWPIQQRAWSSLMARGSPEQPLILNISWR